MSEASGNNNSGSTSGGYDSSAAARNLPLFQVSDPSDNSPIDLDELFNDVYYLNLPGGMSLPDPFPVANDNSSISGNNFQQQQQAGQQQQPAPELSTSGAAASTTVSSAMNNNNNTASNTTTDDKTGDKKRSAQAAGLSSSMAEGGGDDEDLGADGKNLTEQQKIERRERNREHAKRSRLRKKFLLESLQGQIQELEEQIKGLKQAITQELPAEKAEQVIARVCGDKDKFTPLPMPSGFGPVKTLMEPDFRLMSALSGSQQNFAISDPTLPDNPIVYVSQGFLDLTGYTLDQVLGRNCRFLQGPGTDQTAVQVIRKGIADGVDTSVCLLNYRADGTPFWNQFFVAALRDAEGNVVNYVGVQCEVSKAVVEKNMPAPKKKV